MASNLENIKATFSKLPNPFEKAFDAESDLKVGEDGAKSPKDVGVFEADYKIAYRILQAVVAEGSNKVDAAAMKAVYRAADNLLEHGSTAIGDALVAAFNSLEYALPGRSRSMGK